VIVRAQIVFLLTTFTEESFDKSANEIRNVRVFTCVLSSFFPLLLPSSYCRTRRRLEVCC
jgi:hypothetical protein